MTLARPSEIFFASWAETSRNSSDSALKIRLRLVSHGGDTNILHVPLAFQVVESEGRRRDPAEPPVGSTGSLQHQINLLTAKDLLIAISFDKCLRETVEAFDRARGRGIPTFASPTATRVRSRCTATTICSPPTSSPSFTGSYVAPVALLNTIIVAGAHLKPKRALAMLSRTEQEYRTGRRWYEEPLRRNRAATDGNHKPTKRVRKSKKKS